MRRHHLSDEGIDIDNDLSKAFSGAHDATAYSVAGGRVAAGALNIKSWEELVDEGKVDSAKLRLFYKTPAYHDYNWTHVVIPSTLKCWQDLFSQVVL